jgi:hypothetical protein
MAQMGHLDTDVDQDLVPDVYQQNQALELRVSSLQNEIRQRQKQLRYQNRSSLFIAIIGNDVSID